MIFMKNVLIFIPFGHNKKHWNTLPKYYNFKASFNNDWNFINRNHQQVYLITGCRCWCCRSGSCCCSGCCSCFCSCCRMFGCRCSCCGSRSGNWRFVTSTRLTTQRKPGWICAITRRAVHSLITVLTALKPNKASKLKDLSSSQSVTFYRKSLFNGT